MSLLNIDVKLISKALKKNLTNVLTDTVSSNHKVGN